MQTNREILRTLLRDMVSPGPDESVIDSCSRALPVCEAAIRAKGSGSEEIAMAFEGIATAMSVAAVYAEPSTFRRGWEFFLAAAAIRGSDSRSIIMATQELYSVYRLGISRPMDQTTGLLLLGLARVSLQLGDDSAYFKHCLLPLINNEITE